MCVRGGNQTIIKLFFPVGNTLSRISSSLIHHVLILFVMRMI